MQGYADHRPDRRFYPAVAISPDGARVAYSDNASGQFNLVVQAVDGGAPTRLTDYAESTVRVFTWTPDGAALVFSADTNGDEFHQVRRVPAGGGEVVALTDRPGVQHHLGEVSPDGEWVAYGANDREPAHQDVLIQHLKTGETVRVYAEGGFVFPGSFSPDGRWLTVIRLLSNTSHVVYLCPLAGDGEVARILPDASLDASAGGAGAKCLPGPWLADGSGFFLLTDVGRDFVGLARYDIAGRELHWVDTPDWDVEQLGLSDDGRVLVWSVNVDGASRLRARDLTTGADLPVPELPPSQVQSATVDAAGRRVALLLATGASPTNVAVLEIGGDLRWITDAAPVGTDLTGVEPTAVTFPTADGRQVPAWLYRPTGHGPFPVLLSIHGGPEAQERPAYNYSGLYQYLLARGIAVLAPNVRGSTGYGRAYQSLIHRDWGGAELLDFAAAADYLTAQDWADPTRIGLFGASYGGFAVLSCLSRLADRGWACGVDIVGPSNLVTLTRSVPPTWRAQMAAIIGDPDTESEYLLSRSPVTYADAITAPLFVIQGANDPRVPQAESDQVVARLRERGVEVRYDVYPDEGHGFTKRENDARAMGDTAEFLVAHLVLDGG